LDSLALKKKLIAATHLSGNNYERKRNISKN
jgi:hypothetical protein